MARNIPKALATFVSNDTDTARMFNNLQSAIQPLLDFNNKWFQDKGSALNVRGALQAAGVAVSGGISGALTSFRKVPDGTIAAPGLAFLNNTAIGIEREGTGNSEQWNFVYNGVKLLSITKSGYIWTCFSSSAGLMLFNNAAGTLLGTLRNDGTLSLPSFVSGQGFKTKIPLGHVYVNSTTANGGQQTVDPMILVSGSGVTARYCQRTMEYPGSLVGITADCITTIASTQVVAIFKNGTSIWNASVGANTTRGYNTAPKGTYTFAANDVFTASVTYATAVSSTTTATFVTITVELGA